MIPTEVFLIISLLSIVHRISGLSSETTKRIKIRPSYIKTSNLSQSYPETILNKLFSSVPKREKAINNINLDFGHYNNRDDSQNDDKLIQKGLTLLVGRSASGKSTLLRIIAQTEKPITGSFVINGKQFFTEHGETKEHYNLPKPIIIDSKPDCFDTKSTIFQRLVETISDVPDAVSISKETLIVEFATILGFTEEQLHKMRPADLTPSQQYLFGLTQHCLESSCEGVKFCIHDNKKDIYIVPGPILLLDELLDKETSTVAKRVGLGLQNLTKHGGVVIVATHRPQYLTDVAENIVTLSSGKVLSKEKYTQT